MPNPLRSGLPGRVRRPNADHRLHDRTDGGGVLMAAETAAPVPGSGQRDRNHGIWIAGIWLVVALAGDLLIWFVLGPHLPPGIMGSAADGQQFDIKVMSVMAAPVMLFVLVYFSYSMIVWRHRGGDEEDGPALHGNTRVQTTWITVTSVIVLCLAGFGTYQLAQPGGA